MAQLPWLSDSDLNFPPVERALKDPNGLLAVGGDLSPERLINAYRHGIFPWYEEGQPILWWAPAPRLVLFPSNIHVARSLRKVLSRDLFRVTLDQAFAQVIAACAEPREDQAGTWITADMQHAYIRLHQLGYAHSVECWHNDQLVGGLYGIAVGKAFFGESMFSRMSNASKVALIHLAGQLGHEHFGFIDCQMETAHLRSMGAELVSRPQFARLLATFAIDDGAPRMPWHLHWRLEDGFGDTGSD